jgi:hypothetical protein
VDRWWAQKTRVGLCWVVVALSSCK